MYNSFYLKERISFIARGKGREKLFFKSWMEVVRRWGKTFIILGKKSSTGSPSTLSPRKRMLSYQDVSSEKWSLPGSGVVVDGAVVVVSSAFINLEWIAIKISKRKKPFDGKLLSLIAVAFVAGKTADKWMNERVFLCTFNGNISYANYYLFSIRKQKMFYRLWWMTSLSPTNFSHHTWHGDH